MKLLTKTLFAAALLTAPFAASGAAASPRFAPGFDLPESPALVAPVHHRYWHRGGRGHHYGWYKGKKRGKHKGW